MRADMKSTSKSKTIFRCQECGLASPKWTGRCNGCNKWNTLAEEAQARPAAAGRPMLTDFSSAVSLLSEVSSASVSRFVTGNGEFDRMIGGGIVPGSLVLLGGAPGIGKSTLMLQIAAGAARERKVLYVSGEESQEQVKARADRLGIKANNLYLLSETNLETILAAVEKIKPELLVVDSIQTTYRGDLAGAPGTVGQVRECAAEFLRVAKSGRISVFLLGHVTKEGDLAGPRVLEHIVDTVLYFETERHLTYRILRAHKNRFGPTSEIGIFEMGPSGLEEVSNPSGIFMSEHKRGPGSVLTAAVEGSRPFLLEIQALVSRSYFGIPRRMVTGVDFNRALIIMAVLEKRLSLSLGNQDIFINVTGGAKLREPAADLAMAAAIAGAFGNFTGPTEGICIGEVGLGGEIRRVSHVLERLKEAERLGMAWALVPRGNLKASFRSDALEVVEVDSLSQAVRWLKDPMPAILGGQS